MREYLFRAKDAETGKWVYGDIVHLFGEPRISCYGLFINIEPKTISQYTDLNDKNGIKIFEGDILKLNDYHGKRTVHVFYGKSMGCWMYGGDGYSDEYIFNASRKEVIGNIYDNRELLKGE